MLFAVTCVSVGASKVHQYYKILPKDIPKGQGALVLQKSMRKIVSFFRALKKLNKFSRTLKINDILLKMKQES